MKPQASMSATSANSESSSRKNPYIPNMEELTERTFCLLDFSAHADAVNMAKILTMPKPMPAHPRRQDRKVA